MEPDRIVGELGLYFNRPILPGQTLLFLDEIQACPKSIACLCHFYEEMPALHTLEDDEKEGERSATHRGAD